ncbi:hypothetical protein NXS19_004582 [Fusarium pseudograminearum]|nr:hypothetical protein NXS19_004582 [Fusarium pseudograminearum]
MECPHSMPIYQRTTPFQASMAAFFGKTLSTKGFIFTVVNTIIHRQSHPISIATTSSITNGFHSEPPQEVQAASYGAGVSISSRGEAYYYGGWLSNSSIEGWSGPPKASSGLIKYEMDANSWSNLTGPDGTGRAEGAMVFIPVGDGGMLVYFGGTQDLYGNGTLTPQSLDEIFLFDIANGKWYTQKTSGDTPDNRRRFCGGATWAKDQSSYNIYIYGGGGFPPKTAGYDDIYILTIPSFQWIRGPYPTYRNGTGAFPKSMMSCNVVNDAQMLVIGGTYSNTTECDVPIIHGAHNMDLGRQNEKKAIWAAYQPNLTTYVLPVDIRTAIGGSLLVPQRRQFQLMGSTLQTWLCRWIGLQR